MDNYNRLCSVTNCGRKHDAKGFCNKHYCQFIRPLRLPSTIESHNKRYTSEYNTWLHIKDRCLNPKNKSFNNYGGRGIGICDKWINSFTAFYESVGERPSSKYSIDRIDNNGDYEPGNCRWATRTVQQINTRTRKTNKSGTRGVFWDKNRKLWKATIGINYKCIRLGFFKDINEAILVRKVAEKIYHNK